MLSKKKKKINTQIVYSTISYRKRKISLSKHEINVFKILFMAASGEDYGCVTVFFFFLTSLLFLELYTFDTKNTYYFDGYKNHKTLKITFGKKPE